MNSSFCLYTVEYYENGEWYALSKVSLEDAILFIRGQQQKWHNAGNIIKAAEFEQNLALIQTSYCDEEAVRMGRPFEETVIWSGGIEGYAGLDDAIMDIMFPTPTGKKGG